MTPRDPQNPLERRELALDYPAVRLEPRREREPGDEVGFSLGSPATTETWCAPSVSDSTVPAAWRVRKSASATGPELETAHSCRSPAGTVVSSQFSSGG